MKTLVVIPTYNELNNIRRLLPELFSLRANFSVIVVDDNSPDGTAKLVGEMQTQHPQLHLMSRPEKLGVAQAYLTAFQWGLENDYELLVEMDADFSHRPEDLVKLLVAAKSADFVVGSRYIKGGKTVNWPLKRLVLSRMGSLYSSIILGYGLSDWTGGFNAWKAPVLRGIGIENIHSKGYSFQIEMKYRASKRGFKGVEVPIVFVERQVGVSKLSGSIISEALLQVLRLRFGH